jgi:hypothetical protein
MREIDDLCSARVLLLIFLKLTTISDRLAPFARTHHVLDTTLHETRSTKWRNSTTGVNIVSSA